MCTFDLLPLSVDIVNYLVPRWHVSSTSVICLRSMGKDDLGYICDLPMSIISKILLSELNNADNKEEILKYINDTYNSNKKKQL